MFVYDKGRIYTGNISFALPDQVYINFNSDLCDNGIEFGTTDGSLKFTVEEDFSEGQRNVQFIKMLEVISSAYDLSEYHQQKMNGFCAAYISTNRRCYEMRLEIVDEPYDTLIVVISADAKLTAEELLELETVKAFLDSFRLKE